MSSFSARAVQVYIATTKGLVGIQSITDLHDQDLHSVATVNQSSTLAGINNHYVSFVHKPQGIIQDLFANEKQQAYRIDFTHNIDQGNSWQLGVYLAHYLHASDMLAEASDPEKLLKANLPNTEKSAEKSPEKNTKENIYVDDLIFIATGEVNTHNFDVMAIDELSKKCARSKQLIALWQSQNKTICFLAPLDNLKEPVLQSPLRITPIGNLRELTALFKVFSLNVQDPKHELLENAVQEVTSNSDHHFAKLAPDTEDKFEKAESMDATHARQQAQHNGKHREKHQGKKREHNDSFIIETVKEDNRYQSAGIVRESVKPKTSSYSEPSPIKQAKNKRMLLRLLLLISVLFVSIFLIYIKHSSGLFSVNSDLADNRKLSLLFAQRAQSEASCEEANPSILNVKMMSPLENAKASATRMDTLCGLFFVSEKQAMAVWMITDSKALFELKHEPINQALQGRIVEAVLQKQRADESTILEALTPRETLKLWTVPVPEYQVIDRQYHLIVSTHGFDEADKQSLEAYLLAMHQQNKKHSIVDLFDWVEKTQDRSTIYILEHELSR